MILCGVFVFAMSTGIVDNGTNLHYSNMLDAQVDAVYAAMARLGYSNVSVVVGETGWPSAGDPTEIGVSIANAQLYNGNLIKHITSNVGTPSKPNVPVDAYIFALYNENLKPGPCNSSPTLPHNSRIIKITRITVKRQTSKISCAPKIRKLENSQLFLGMMQQTL